MGNASLESSTQNMFQVIDLSQQSNKAWTATKLSYINHFLLANNSSNTTEEIPIDNHFQIISEQPEEHIYTLQFYSVQKQQLVTWKIRPTNAEVQNFDKTLKELLEFRWKNSKFCEICEKRFGLFIRKHHCRKCARCVCKNCSPFRSTLPELTYKEFVRICVQCSQRVTALRKGEI